MRFAIVEDGRVVNVVESDMSRAPGWIESDTANIGDVFDGVSFHRQVLDVLALRRAAYAIESDHLKIEAEYDALIASAEPDFTEWLAAVAAIKVRYPLESDAPIPDPKPN